MAYDRKYCMGRERIRNEYESTKTKVTRISKNEGFVNISFYGKTVEDGNSLKFLGSRATWNRRYTAEIRSSMICTSKIVYEMVKHY